MWVAITETLVIGDYRTLANKGVGGVVVKLTEDTWYKNPNAENQIRNAQAAGLQVSTYHFSRYTSEEAARAEARFYIAEAQRLNLPKNTLMVNDFEDAKMQPNINSNTQAWADEMRKNGYTNLMFYTSASWLDENNLHKKDLLILRSLGLKTFGLLSIQRRNFLRMMLKLFVIMERQELGSSLLKQNYFQGNTFLIIILIIQGDLQQIINRRRIQPKVIWVERFPSLTMTQWQDALMF